VSATELSTRLTALRASTAAMLAGFDAQRFTDDDMAAPTELPDWTRGHVLTHIARNADGIGAALAGALRGEIVARYPRGRVGRAADIQAGATRPAVEVLADVHESADRLDRVFGAVEQADAWDAMADDRPARTWVRARWQEVEIHRVDAAAGYGPEDWPAEFIALLVPRLADQLPERTQQPVRVEITADGARALDLVGRTWSVPGADPVDVRGPDWAVLAWLVGRSSPSVDRALTAQPDLTPWL
jgi:maleylpyruvate isomerase